MAFSELANRRTKSGKHYLDNATGKSRYEQRIGTVLHYPTAGPNSATLDGTIDLTPVRVNNAVFDGWRITANDWHYAIGKDIPNHGQEDGWVGFGGRQGEHWFKFRLERAGYLKWSTREWGDLGAVDYNRARLTRTTNSITVGPAGATATINTLCQARWNDMWPALPSGQVDILWRVEGRELKEEIIINQAAREWIAANRPPGFFFPGTPASDVYFGFVFKLDWSDVPRIYRGGTQKQIADDYDDGETITLQDNSLNHLLDFMPLDRLFVPGTIGQLTLRKRFYSEGGNYYLLVGARCDKLAALPAGDLVFDPTLTAQPDATAGKDARIISGQYAANNYETHTTLGVGAYGEIYHSLLQFDVSGIPASASVDDATLTLVRVSVDGDGGGTNSAYRVKRVWVENQATWNIYSTGNNWQTEGCEGANDRDASAIASWSSAATIDAALTASLVEEWVSGAFANNGIMVKGATESGQNLSDYCSSDHGTAGNRPKLVVNYTEASAGWGKLLSDSRNRLVVT